MKRILPLLIGALIGALLVTWYTRLSASQKRFAVHLIKQAPYLPARYFV